MSIREYTKSIDGQEKKFVSKEWYQNEIDIINWKFRNNLDYYSYRDFELYNLNNDCRLSEPIKIGVRWISDKGSTSKAEIFAYDLLEVCKIAKEFKYNGYYIDREIDKNWTKEDQQEIKKYVEFYGIEYE